MRKLGAAPDYIHGSAHAVRLQPAARACSHAGHRAPGQPARQDAHHQLQTAWPDQRVTLVPQSLGF